MRTRYPLSEQNGVPGVRLSRVRFPRIHACCRFRSPGRNLRAWGAIRRPAVCGCPRSGLHSARYCRAHPRSGIRNPREGAGDYRPLPVARILPGKAPASRSDQAMRTSMRNVVSKPCALLFVMAAACLTFSCSKQAPVHASDAQPTDIPTVAVAKVSTEDLSHGLVLTAEFKPFQEVDVMAKVAGFVKQINVDVGDRVKQGQLLATLEIPEMADDLRRAGAAVVRARAEVTRAQDEQRRAESVHSIAHLSFQRISTVAVKKPGLVAQQEIDEAQSSHHLQSRYGPVAPASSGHLAAGGAEVRRVKPSRVQIGRASCR